MSTISDLELSVYDIVHGHYIVLNSLGEQVNQLKSVRLGTSFLDERTIIIGVINGELVQYYFDRDEFKWYNMNDSGDYLDTVLLKKD